VELYAMADTAPFDLRMSQVLSVGRKMSAKRKTAREWSP